MNEFIAICDKLAESMGWHFAEDKSSDHIVRAYSTPMGEAVLVVTPRELRMNAGNADRLMDLAKTRMNHARMTVCNMNNQPLVSNEWPKEWQA